MAFKYYYYNEQIRKYLTQFVHLFSGLRISTGKRDNGQSIFVTVPVRYASQDRMANMIVQARGNSDPYINDRVNASVPIMSAYMAAIDLRPEARRHPNIIDRKSYITVQDMEEASDATDAVKSIRVKARSIPTPYMLTMELHMFASNTDQHLQMLEQILMLFNPDLMIQSNDSEWDWTSITRVTLTDVGLDTEIPIGTEDTVIGSTLSFELPIWLSGPMVEVKGSGFVEGIRTVIRDGTPYTGKLDELVIGDAHGSIPDGVTSTGTGIDLMGTPLDVTEDPQGTDSGHSMPPPTDVNTP